MPEPQEMVLARGMVNGGLTGMLEILCTYPIKYVKTQLQLEEKMGTSRRYSGVWDCTKATINEHGFFGLYRGLNVFLYGPKAAVRFGVFEALKQRFSDERGVLSIQGSFLCGLAAGAVEAAVVNTPMEAVEVRMIDDMRKARPRFRGYLHGVVVTYREEGLRGLYYGLVPSVIKQASNQGIRFFVVESLKRTYQGGDPTVAVPKLMTGAFGGVAGVLSVVGNNPIDMVKTRMQGLNAERYKSTPDCFMQIWRDEGFLSFYRGMTPRLTRVGLEVALTFMIYDLVKDGLKIF